MTDTDTTPIEDPICCTRCGVTKPADEFKRIRKKTTRRDNLCQPCRTAYQHEHYVKHRERYIKNAARRREAARDTRTGYLLEYLSTHPCVDCGESDPVVLEFDHRGDKLFNIGHEFRDRAWKDVLAEIDKCDVRCGNCHRIRTVEAHGWARAVCPDA